MARLSISDLEIEEREEPFEVEMEDGTVFTFKDPKAISAAGLLTFDPTQPIQIVRLALGDEEAVKFLARPEADGYLLNAVFKKYMEHFRLPLPGEADASSR